MISDEALDQVRRVERLYENYLRRVHRAVATEDFTIADSRVLHEMGFIEGGVSGAWIAARLDLDTAYLSRIFRKLEAYDLVLGRSSGDDGRMKDWELTDRGRDFAASIEKEYRDRTRLRLMIDLSPGELRELLAALSFAERLLLRAQIRAPFAMR